MICGDFHPHTYPPDYRPRKVSHLQYKLACVCVCVCVCMCLCVAFMHGPPLSTQTDRQTDTHTVKTCNNLRQFVFIKDSVLTLLVTRRVT